MKLRQGLQGLPHKENGLLACVGQTRVMKFCSLGYSLPNAYKSLGSALKTLIDITPSKRERKKFESRLQALKASATEAKQRSKAKRGKRSSMSNAS